MVERPQTRYAWNGDVSIAYQVLGDGPVDLVYMQGFLSNLELNWEQPALGRFLRDLSRFSRLIVTDRRGLGCSERFTPADSPPIEGLMDDLLAVLDVVGSERPTLFATGDCGFLASLFAATYPGRLDGLILYGASPTWRKTDETPWQRTDAELEESLRSVCHDLDATWTRKANPSLAADERQVGWGLRYERVSLTPGSCYADGRRFRQTDVRAVLPSIQVPTLVLHRTRDPEEPVESGRYLASHIPAATLFELPGIDHFPWVGDQGPIVREVERFVASIRAREAELDRVLATVLFTDIVGSTERAAELGDRGWRDLIGRHHSTVRALLARYRGTEIDTAGDGFFATFDGPARAVRCALAIVDAVKSYGLQVRAGVHTGEVETVDGKIGGVAVHIGSRVMAIGGGSEVLVSQTVKDLVAGSRLTFDDRGVHRLKGVPGEWRLYAAAGESA